MTFSNSPNINHLWAALMVEELVRNGVEYFCIAPGSRSSPLTAAVALHKKAKEFIHFDERGLAFHALGYCTATGKPCVLISTSGTAVANFFPAIIEASKKKLPLIVITADRPPELRFTGADQTIDQVKIFGEYVRWSFDMPCPTQKINPEVVLTTVDQAVYRSRGQVSGPVHLNCMYREPLALEKTSEKLAAYLTGLKSWLTTQSAYTQYAAFEKSLSVTEKKKIVSQLQKVKNGIIILGKLSSIAEQKSVLKLAQKLKWPVFADITSGLRIGPQHKSVIAYFDQLLLSDKIKNQLNIDGVLHLGGRITSKRWYRFIEKQKPKQYIMVLNHPLRNDPLHNVTLRSESSVEAFCRDIVQAIKVQSKSTAHARLQKISNHIDVTMETFLKSKPSLTEPLCARLISQHIPKDHGLFLASSMPIRDMDMYAAPGKNHVVVNGNRGASGIDGLVASACGYATGLKKPVTLFIGDLALLHDLNSLAMLKSSPHPIIIVVLNNDGGGIFSFLPIAKHHRIFDKFFGTPHGYDFKSVSTMFDLDYANPKTQNQWIRDYKTALNQKQSTIIEIKTNRNNNAEFHQKLQSKIRRSVEAKFAK